MKEIKIVFKDTNNENPYKEGCYDLYIDGVKQERVKRFSIDLPMIPYDPENSSKNSKNINLDLYSYTLEKFCDIWKD